MLSTEDQIRSMVSRKVLDDILAEAISVSFTSKIRGVVAWKKGRKYGTHEFRLDGDQVLLFLGHYDLSVHQILPDFMKRVGAR